MDRKIRVLFLPKWYPNRYDPMPGLFIMRQAEAITPFCDVAVIYVHPDPDCPNNLEVDFSEENEVRVLRVYYKVKGGTSSFVRKVLNFRQFYKAHLKAFHSIREFCPDIVHAHILTRMGLIGLKISRQQKIPLVISEHWSRYFPASDSYHGWFRKLMTGFVVKKAAAIVAVSDPLRDAMQQFGLYNKNFRIIPNVVDLSPVTLTAPPDQTGMKTLVHISCFEDRSKNISGFLRSIKELSVLRQDFICLLVGTGPDWNEMMEYAGFLGVLDSFVRFTGLKTGDEFAGILGRADFSVLSSRYETFGTVVIESLVSGVPVVATAVGVAREVIHDANGILVPPGDEKAMTDALEQMLSRCRRYDKSLISNEIVGRFSRETIGGQIVALYRELTSVASKSERY